MHRRPISVSFLQVYSVKLLKSTNALGLVTKSCGTSMSQSTAIPMCTHIFVEDWMNAYAFGVLQGYVLWFPYQMYVFYSQWHVERKCDEIGWDKKQVKQLMAGPCCSQCSCFTKFVRGYLGIGIDPQRRTADEREAQHQ